MPEKKPVVSKDNKGKSQEAPRKPDQAKTEELEDATLDEVSGGITPRDASTGMAVGRRSHKPVLT